MPSPAQWSLRQRLAIGGLAVGPILATVGSALMPKDSSHAVTEYTRFAAHRDTHYVGFLLLAVGAWLLVPGATALMQLFRGRGSRVGTVACVALAIGAISTGAGSLLQGTATWIATSSKVSAFSGVSLLHAASNNALAGLPWFVGLLLFLGMLAVGITLLHAKTAPWWQAVLMILAPIGIFLGGSGPIVLPFSIPVVAASLALAYTIWRMADGAVDGSAGSIDLTEQVPTQAEPADTKVTAKAKAPAKTAKAKTSA